MYRHDVNINVCSTARARKMHARVWQRSKIRVCASGESSTGNGCVGAGQWESTLSKVRLHCSCSQFGRGAYRIQTCVTQQKFCLLSQHSLETPRGHRITSVTFETFVIKKISDYICWIELQDTNLKALIFSVPSCLLWNIFSHPYDMCKFNLIIFSDLRKYDV